MYVQPLDGPLGPNSLSAPNGTAQGEGALSQGTLAPAAGDNISRFVPPWSNGTAAATPYADGYGNSGSLQGMFGPLMGVLQQLMQMLQSLMGYGCNAPYSGGNCPPGGNERYFQNATGASDGDPHLSFNGQKWLVAAWISAGSVTDLLLPAWTGNRFRRLRLPRVRKTRPDKLPRRRDHSLHERASE